jgi:hypothetical protein
MLGILEIGASYQMEGIINLKQRRHYYAAINTNPKLFAVTITSITTVSSQNAFS